MGYETRVTGMINIEPPLPYGQIKASPFRVHNRDTVLAFEEDHRVEDTDEGTLSKVTAVGIRARDESLDKHYGVDIELTKIVEAYPGHRFTGELVICGVEPGDISRLRVEYGAGPGRGMVNKVVKEKATLTWPDGSPVQL
jgi:hypothetical protein